MMRKYARFAILEGQHKTRTGSATNAYRPSDDQLGISKEVALVKRTPFPLTDEEIARFWAKVDRSGGPDSCWPWTAHRSERGYGHWSVRRDGKQRQVLSHRIAFTIDSGEQVTADTYVCHACDNPPCCNPAHLWLGTPRDNVHDAMAKGRMKLGSGRLFESGESHPRAKLTEDDVRSIRRRHACGEIGMRALAREFSVSCFAIYSILIRRTWKEVE